MSEKEEKRCPECNGHVRRSEDLGGVTITGERACRACGLVIIGPWLPQERTRFEDDSDRVVYSGRIDEIGIASADIEHWKGRFNERGEYQGEAPTQLQNHPRGSDAATHWQKGQIGAIEVDVQGRTNVKKPPDWDAWNHMHSAQHDLGRSGGGNDSKSVRRREGREAVYQLCTVTTHQRDRARWLRDTDPWVDSGWNRVMGDMSNQGSAVGYAAAAQFDSEAEAIDALDTNHPISKAVEFVGREPAEKAIGYAFKRAEERRISASSFELEGSIKPNVGRMQSTLMVV